MFPSAVGLNVLLDEDDKVKVAGGFLLKIAKCQGRRNCSVSKTHPRNASYFYTFGKWDYIEVLKAIYGDESYKTSVRRRNCFQCDCSKERFMNALASLPPPLTYKKWRMKITELKLSANSAKQSTLTRTTWRNSSVTNLILDLLSDWQCWDS